MGTREGDTTLPTTALPVLSLPGDFLRPAVAYSKVIEVVGVVGGPNDKVGMCELEEVRLVCTEAAEL